MPSGSYNTNTSVEGITVAQNACNIVDIEGQLCEQVEKEHILVGKELVNFQTSASFKPQISPHS